MCGPVVTGQSASTMAELCVGGGLEGENRKRDPFLKCCRGSFLSAPVEKSQEKYNKMKNKKWKKKRSENKKGGISGGKVFRADSACDSYSCNLGTTCWPLLPRVKKVDLSRSDFLHSPADSGQLGLGKSLPNHSHHHQDKLGATVPQDKPSKSK